MTAYDAILAMARNAGSFAATRLRHVPRGVSGTIFLRFPRRDYKLLSKGLRRHVRRQKAASRQGR